MSSLNNNIIDEHDIRGLLIEKNPSISDSALKWELFRYIKDNHLVRIGVKKYAKDAKTYFYEYQSSLSTTIDEFLSKEYPEVKTVIWESRQLNEWLNFLMNTNIIFVEAEKDCVDYVFSSLNEFLGQDHLVLLNPDENVISRYLREDLVLVKTLYSKSPISKSNRKIKLEKLMVDVVAKDYFLDTRGIEDIVLGIKSTYAIDIDKMFAYASRRRVKDKVQGMWELNND